MTAARTGLSPRVRPRSRARMCASDAPSLPSTTSGDEASRAWAALIRSQSRSLSSCLVRASMDTFAVAAIRRCISSAGDISRLENSTGKPHRDAM